MTYGTSHGRRVWRFWYIRGHVVAEGLDWLDRAITAAHEHLTTPLVADLDWGRTTCSLPGESERARTYLTQALTLARHWTIPSRNRPSPSSNSASSPRTKGFPAATRILEEARDLYATLPVSTSPVHGLLSPLAVVAYGRGDLEEAASPCVRKRSRWRRQPTARIWHRRGPGTRQARRWGHGSDEGRAGRDSTRSGGQSLTLYVASQDPEGVPAASPTWPSWRPPPGSGARRLASRVPLRP